jgi:hypothetical protein
VALAVGRHARRRFRRSHIGDAAGDVRKAKRGISTGAKSAAEDGDPGRGAADPSVRLSARRFSR